MVLDFNLLKSPNAYKISILCIFGKLICVKVFGGCVKVFGGCVKVFVSVNPTQHSEMCADVGTAAMAQSST